MKLAGKTDVGSVRPENQDDYRAGELNSDAAWGLVCDGMGGARGGREASVSACDVIEHSFHEQYAQCLPGDEEKFLKRALINANRFVFQKASREEELAGMGTTAVCALVRGGNAFICHAGDSRAYLVRDGRLTQLTHDHSYVQELVDCGTITAEEAEHHPQKNIITRALGVDYRLEPEFTSVPVQKGDMLLLCTDGLTNVMTSLSKYRYLSFLLILFTVYAVLPVIGMNNFINGNRMMFFLVVYSIGGYLRLHCQDKIKSIYHTKYRNILIAALILILLGKGALEMLGVILNKPNAIITKPSLYFGEVVGIPLATIMFLTFATMKMRYNKYINMLAETVLGVYLMITNFSRRRLYGIIYSQI